MLNFRLDQLSFWLGFLGGLLFWWFWRMVRPLARELREITGRRVRSVAAGLSAGIERRYRQDVVRIVQDGHLASSLFALDEIAIRPHVLAPPPPVIPDGQLPPDDALSLTLPYLPDWPELAAIYRAPTLTFEKALGQGANLLVFGHPGLGKSFALNYLASRLARRDPEVRDLSGLVPVPVHVADLSLPAEEKKLLDVIYGALYEKVSTLVEAQLPSFLETIFKQGRALLLVDGADELPPQAVDPVVDYLAALRRRYSGLRMVATASPEHLFGLDRLALMPIALAAWTAPQVESFISKWGELWQEHLRGEPWAKDLGKQVDPRLLNGWLLDEPTPLNPLILTLKVWAAYAGDALGPKPLDALEAYVRRMTVDVANARQAGEQLATQMALTMQPVLPRNMAGDFVAQFEDPDAPPDLEPSTQALDLLAREDERQAAVSLAEEDLRDLEDLDIPDAPQREETKPERAVSGRRVRRMLPEMVKSELLAYRADSRVSFAHPLVGSYLAGCGLANLNGGQELLAQPNWSGRNGALEYMAAKGGAGALMNDMLDQQVGGPLESELLTAGRWPRLADGSAPWSASLLRSLATLLNREGSALGLRGRALAALAMSGDPAISTLFQRMLTSTQHETRQLGALGCGAIRDVKAIGDLTGLLYDSMPNVGRAACLALVAIDTDQSLDAAATALLQASEDVRRAAAEALSQHAEEGHPILKEGSALDDLLVRRSVAFGLGRVKEPWAREILEHMQIEDGQWVVRTTAGQFLEAWDKPDPRIPTPPPPLTETPWLISFASERGKGVAPGQASWDLLATALKQGNEDQRLAALERYRLAPSESQAALPEIYRLQNGGDFELREAACNTLWHLNAAGVELPPSAVFGGN